MAEFKFKLEPVLKQRKQLEDQAQRDLAQLLRHQMILENQLRDMQQTINTNKHALTDVLKSTVEVSHVRQHGVHVNHVRAKAQQIVLQMLALNRQIDNARAVLQQAMKQRKAIELLRDKQYEDWRKTTLKREALELDEISTQQYIRRHLEGVIS